MLRNPVNKLDARTCLEALLKILYGMTVSFKELRDMNYWEGKSVASNDSTEDSCAFLENSCDQERDACGDESTEEVNRIIAQQFSLFQQGSQVAVSNRTDDCGNYRNTQPPQRNEAG